MIEKGSLVQVNVGEVEYRGYEELDQKYINRILEDEERVYEVKEVQKPGYIVLNDSILGGTSFNEEELTLVPPPENKKKVLTKWNTDGELAVIYQVENMLFFYNTNNDPNFKKGQELGYQEAKDTNPYKVTPFSMGNVPNDAYMSVMFAWEA